MNWYMGLDGDRVVGWSREQVNNYIPVDESIYEISLLHPDYIWDGTTLVEYVPPIPPPPLPYIPTSVTMRQARLQLAVLGVYQAVNQAVASMGDAAQIEWEYATSVDRANPLTSAMVQLLGWTEAQTDDYFAAASQL